MNDARPGVAGARAPAKNAPGRAPSGRFIETPPRSSGTRRTEPIHDPRQAMAPDHARRTTDHGNHCDCVALAGALHLDREAISFDFCRRVLQRHWAMTCRHGSRHAAVPPDATSGRWRDIGPVDAVKAILIHERPAD